jgi:succinate dehydrogenase / fumarate reductase membrane anchor subunit
MSGSGSVKSSTRPGNAASHHWWVQRMTSLALIPLTIWFLASLFCVISGDYGRALSWLGNPFSAAMMILFVVVCCHHAVSGLEVVIDDYVHHPARRALTLATVKGLGIVLGLTGVLSVLIVVIGR